MTDKNQLVDKGFFDINPNQLDQEWIRQPRLYWKYAEKVAQARQDWDEAKAELSVVAAELNLEIRKNPGDFGLEKITEDTVKAVIASHTEYTSAEDQVRQAKYRMDIYQAAVEALDHRKKALENLVQLRLANYYSTPTVPQNGERFVQEAEKSNRPKIKPRSYPKTKPLVD